MTTNEECTKCPLSFQSQYTYKPLLNDVQTFGHAIASNSTNISIYIRYVGDTSCRSAPIINNIT